MSFVFPSWETAFSPSFHEDAKKMLEGALNKVSSHRELVISTARIRADRWQGNKPPVIQGKIEVVELSMGKQVSPKADFISISCSLCSSADFS